MSFQNLRRKIAVQKNMKERVVSGEYIPSDFIKDTKIITISPLKKGKAIQSSFSLIQLGKIAKAGRKKVQIIIVRVLSSSEAISKK